MPAETPTPEQPAQDGEAEIAFMVKRFLGWRLPEDYRPDGGISFKATFNEHTAYPGRHEPTGTNLLDATQAEAMVRYLIDGMPALAPPAQTQQGLSDKEKIGREVADLLGRAYVPDPREGEPGDAETYEGAAPLNPDKQPSPSAAPAQEMEEELGALRALKDGAYRERNQCVALILRMALALGWRAGVGRHEDKPGEKWEADWRTLVSVDLPTGQASWHFHDSEVSLLEGLPEYAGQWDGHDTTEKYRRVNAARPAQPASPEGALREALEQVKAALGDRLLNRGPLSFEYAHSVMRQIDAALAGQPAREDAINQCDGCRAGRPIDKNGNHRMGDGDYPNLQACQRHLYSPAQPAREALRYARDHITGSAPLWRTQSEVIDIIDSALHDPIGTYRCPVCNKDTPHHHASIEQAAVAREDGQKGTCANFWHPGQGRDVHQRRAAAGDLTAVHVDLVNDSGCLNWKAATPTKEDDQKALRAAWRDAIYEWREAAQCMGGRTLCSNCVDALVRALAGSPAGEGREDNQEQQSGKGAK